MAGKVEAVRTALYVCFPDQARTEVNNLVDTDQGIKYTLTAFKLEEIPERAMLVGLHHTAGASISGFLWVTNKRLLFVTAFRGFRPRAFIREYPYSGVREVQYDKSSRFQVARITLRRVERAEPIVFESIVKPDPLQSFVEYLQHKVANPHAPAPTEAVEAPADEGANGDFSAALELLDQLKSQGVFAEDKFEAVKKKLLGG